jgi:hypothetical protein
MNDETLQIMSVKKLLIKNMLIIQSWITDQAPLFTWSTDKDLCRPRPELDQSAYLAGVMVYIYALCTVILFVLLRKRAALSSLQGKEVGSTIEIVAAVALERRVWKYKKILSTKS